MGKMLISLDDATEKKFREITLRLFGDKKWVLSIAGSRLFVSGMLGTIFS